MAGAQFVDQQSRSIGKEREDTYEMDEEWKYLLAYCTCRVMDMSKSKGNGHSGQPNFGD